MAVQCLESGATPFIDQTNINWTSLCGPRVEKNRQRKGSKKNVDIAVHVRMRGGGGAGMSSYVASIFRGCLSRFSFSRNKLLDFLLVKK